MKNKKGIAIVPGSFDPITYGHIDIIKRASMLYDKVYVAVMINAEKEYMFSLDQRLDIAKAALREMDGVEVIASDGMLWQLAKALCADALVKGYRNEIDLEYENKMAEYNKAHYPEAKTVLLKADRKLEKLSSTVIREKLRNNESLEGFVPQEEIKKIYSILNQR